MITTLLAVVLLVAQGADEGLSLPASEDGAVIQSISPAVAKSLIESEGARTAEQLKLDPDLGAAAAAAARDHHYSVEQVRACVLDGQAIRLDPSGAAINVLCPSDWDEIAQKSHAERLEQVLKTGSTEGYGKTHWGMSVAQIRRLYPKAENHDGLLVFQDKIERFSASIVFRFVNDHLVLAVVGFDREQHVPMSDKEVCSQVGRLLEAKYGQPLSQSDSERFWSTGKTEITLKHDPLKIQAPCSILYFGAEFRGIQEKLDTASAASKL
jgi:hypothetical protein